jgi:hypothetical protein
MVWNGDIEWAHAETPSETKADDMVENQIWAKAVADRLHVASFCHGYSTNFLRKLPTSGDGHSLSITYGTVVKSETIASTVNAKQWTEENWDLTGDSSTVHLVSVKMTYTVRLVEDNPGGSRPDIYVNYWDETPFLIILPNEPGIERYSHLTAVCDWHRRELSPIGSPGVYYNPFLRVDFWVHNSNWQTTWSPELT